MIMTKKRHSDAIPIVLAQKRHSEGPVQKFRLKKSQFVPADSSRSRDSRDHSQDGSLEGRSTPRQDFGNGPVKAEDIHGVHDRDGRNSSIRQGSISDGDFSRTESAGSLAGVQMLKLKHRHLRPASRESLSSIQESNMPMPVITEEYKEATY